MVEFAGKEVYKSKIIKKTKEPVWNESVKLLISHMERKYAITIHVYDWDKATSNGMYERAEQKREVAKKIVVNVVNIKFLYLNRALLYIFGPKDH